MVVITGLIIVLLGFLISLIGFLLVAIGAITEKRGEKKDVEAGGVLIIGPIPIIFGTSKRTALISAVIGLVLIVVFIILITLLA
ncbi:TIGR00304 family membrane protein [Thermogladius sp. 4427co]|uniref:TIGR00304 family membrane protein n=1 Tax=Thermogladius sp. 4427co TaxID=3450718 RepID=UPI003F7927E9